jgi:acyl-CoA thioester hydrolase
MGFVYYANYLVYFEVGRTSFVRQVWKPYSEIEKEGYILPVLSASIEYKNSASYDDLLTIETTLKSFSRTRLQFDYQVFREDGTLLAIGHTEHCFLYPSGKPRRMPEELWEVLNGMINEN